jgi:hypothetical protein
VAYWGGGISVGPTLRRPRVDQPTKFELVIDLKTAEVLGLYVPPTTTTA